MKLKGEIMHSFTIKDKEIKVESIMKKINENIEEKKKSGFYKDKEIKNISEMKTSLSDNSNYIQENGPNMNEDIHTPYSNKLEGHRQYLNQNWESILNGLPIRSHRKIIGPLVFFFKKIIFFLLRPIINLVLDSQARFNSELVKLLNLLVGKSRELGQIKSEIDLRLDALADRQEYLDHFCKELDSKYDKLIDRLDSEIEKTT